MTDRLTDEQLEMHALSMPSDWASYQITMELLELRKELDRYKRRFHDAQSKLAEWQEHTGCECPSAAQREVKRLRERLAGSEELLQLNEEQEHQTWTGQTFP